MDREMIGTGRTYEAAVEDACKKLGVDQENVDYEVLERPRTALFGLKHIPAKVKITLKEEYAEKLERAEKAAREAAARQTRQERPRQERPAAQQPQRPAQQPRPAQPQQPQRPAAQQPRPAQQPQAQQAQPQQPQRPTQQPPRQPREDRPIDERQKKEQRPPKKERRPDTPREERQNAPQAQPKPEEPIRELSPEVLAEKGEAAAQYIREVLTAFGYPEAKVTVGQKDGMIALQLEGEGLGAVVGRRGDNLDAMQYLASLVANKADGGYCRVVLDVDDYRSKREASLQAYARKMASQAVRTGRSATLEPMNPYERRIVHSAVQTVEGATSRSIGSEPNRRVVISSIAGPKAPQSDMAEQSAGAPQSERPPRDNRPPRGNGRGGQGGGNRDGFRGGRGGRDRDRDRRDSQKVILPPSDEPPKSDDAGISLYGKIEL